MVHRSYARSKGEKTPRDCLLCVTEPLYPALRPATTSGYCLGIRLLYHLHGSGARRGSDPGKLNKAPAAPPLVMTSGEASVPSWDGRAASFQEYEEVALLWEASTPWHKRYMNGPKLAGELQGPARRLVLGKPAEWLARTNGVHILLSHLRTCLGKPQISELSDYLNAYFRMSRRRVGENMSDYVTRKCELYLRAQQALRRVRQTKDAGRPRWNSSSWSWNPSRRSSWDSEATSEKTSQAAAPVAEPADPAWPNGQWGRGDQWWSTSTWSWTQPWGGYSYSWPQSWDAGESGETRGDHPRLRPGVVPPGGLQLGHQ